MSSGWVKFHRKIEEWEWYSDTNTFRLFFHLVLKANHKDNRWKGVEVKRGQFITSLDTLSSELNLSIQQIRTSMNKLKSTGEITINSTNKFSLVTIENYALYQSSEEDSTSKLTNEQTNEQQPINNKQELKNKKKSNISPNDVEIVWSMYPRKEGKSSAFKTIPKLIEKHGLDQIIRCVERYSAKLKSDNTDKKYILQGSTFFNGRYEDFLDSNYSEVGSKVSLKQVEVIIE